MGSQAATLQFAIAGKNIVGTITKSAVGEIAHIVSIAAAKSGTLTTRTSATAGVATLAAGHGMVAGDKIDIYWSGGLRYDCDVDSVGGVDDVEVTFSGGSGDDLPVQDTSLTACEPTVLDTDFDGNKLEMQAATSSQRGHLVWRDSNAANAYAAELLASTPNFFVKDSGQDNPLENAGIDELRVSNASGSVAADFKIAVAYNSDE